MVDDEPESKHSGSQPAWFGTRARGEAPTRRERPERTWAQSGWEFSKLIAGVFIKSFGGVLTGRFVSDVIASELLSAMSARDPQHPPDADDWMPMVQMLTLFAVFMMTIELVATPAMANHLTRRRNLPGGGEAPEVHRIGGAAHETLARGLAHTATVVTVVAGINRALGPAAGSGFVAPMIFSLVDNLRQFAYCTVRTVSEVPGARMIPSRTYLDAKGFEMPPAVASHWMSNRYWLVGAAIPHAVLISLAFLEVVDWLAPQPDDPTWDGRFKPRAALALAFYEMGIWLVAEGVSSAAASRLGYSTWLNLPPASGGKNYSTDTVLIHLPPETRGENETEETREIRGLVGDIGTALRTDPGSTPFGRAWRSLVDRMPSRHVFEVVDGYRYWFNDVLNWMLADPRLQSLGGVGLSLATSVIVGIAETGFVRLEAGLGASAIEGQVDEPLFDRLQFIFQLEDLLYTAINGSEHPARLHGTSILTRHPDRETLRLIRDMPEYAGVREHFRRLQESGREAGLQFNAAISRQLPQAPYPPKAMRDAFGHLSTRDPMRAESPYREAYQGVLDRAQPRVDASRRTVERKGGPDLDRLSMVEGHRLTQQGSVRMRPSAVRPSLGAGSRAQPQAGVFDRVRAAQQAAEPVRYANGLANSAEDAMGRTRMATELQDAIASASISGDAARDALSFLTGLENISPSDRASVSRAVTRAQTSSAMAQEAVAALAHRDGNVSVVRAAAEAAGNAAGIVEGMAEPDDVHLQAAITSRDAAREKLASLGSANSAAAAESKK